jgi:hypothetical protein
MSPMGQMGLMGQMSPMSLMGLMSPMSLMGQMRALPHFSCHEHYFAKPPRGRSAVRADWYAETFIHTIP